MKKPDDSLLVSLTWVCRATRRSPQAVRRWGLRAKRKGRATYYRAPDVFDKVREIENTTSPQAELASERAALARSQRRKIDRENDASENFLLDARTVAEEWSHVFLIVRNRILNLSSRLQQLIVETDVAEIAAREIEQALNELADHGSKYDQSDNKSRRPGI